MALTYHSFGQFVLYGWGYEDSYPPNKDQLHAMGSVAAEAMQKANGGSSYTVGSVVEAIGYAAAGLFIHPITHTRIDALIFATSEVCDKLGCLHIYFNS